jgi:hypothetical protein
LLQCCRIVATEWQNSCRFVAKVKQMNSLLLGFAIASTLIADVPPGEVAPNRPNIPNDTTGACANQDVGANHFDINGVCVYENSGYGWFYLKNGKAYGATCSLNDQWCNGFSSKEQAIEASKK